LLEDVDAIHITEADVEKDKIGRLIVGHAKSGSAVLGFDDVVAPLFALLAERPAYEAFVIDDENLGCGHFPLRG
jgi:hypothetical protein